MKKIIILFLTFVLASCINKSNAPDFEFGSQDIKPGSSIKVKHVFDGFGCVGDNISPQLFWKNAPKDTKSFAITVYDPDAPTGSGWWHWIALNIPASYGSLSQEFGGKNEFLLNNDITQIKNDYGTYSFGGPCPPEGDKPHRYIFTIYALKTDKIAISQNSSAALAGFMINANMIAKKSFVAHYGR
ncbi:MAG: YbhB/YbcL family Raf kinase inhibitor-like protein [Rickettsiales bacterium]|nr:YbhB/YbcL family Raf kinase inhibitor-like protein [Rickettsiales bacterium]